MNNKYFISGFTDEIAQDLTTQLESMKKLDMHYMEMRGVDGNNLIFHTKDKVKEIKERLDEAGVKLSALGSPLGKIGIGDSFENHFEEFKRAVEIAHKMESKNIRMFSFYVPEGKGDSYKGEVFDRIGHFVDYAKVNDVILLHENEKGIYGEKAKECLELMNAFGGEHFKAIFDFANFVQVKQDTMEAYKMLKQYIAYIHVKDAILKTGQVVPAGMGDGNVETILRDLYVNGFQGFLSLEPHLSQFTGFAGLERCKDKLEGTDTSELSSYETFSLAKESLFRILRTI